MPALQPDSSAEWWMTIRRFSLLHSKLKSCKEVSAKALMAEKWASECSRKTWLRMLQQMAAIGAPIEYRQLPSDVIYRYTEKWNLWKAIESFVEGVGAQ